MMFGSELTVRRGQAKDAVAIVAFNKAMALETEDKQLDPTLVSSGVKAMAEDRTDGFYLVAEYSGRIIGSLMVTYEWSDWRNGLFWWIQSVFVHPNYRRRGVFRALFQAVRSEATADVDVCGIRLYVEQDNERAQQTYRALGMAETAYRLYELEFE